MKVGPKIILLYLVIYYAIPYFGGIFYNFSYLYFLNGFPTYTLGAIFALVFCAFFTFFYTTLNATTPIFHRLRFDLYSLPLNYFLLFIYLFASFIFFKDYGISFRHKGSAISESSLIITVLLFLNIYFHGYLLYILSKVSFGNKLSNVNYFYVVIILASSLLSMTGAYDIIKIITALLILTHRHINLLFYNRIDALKAVSSAVFISITFCLSFFVGLVNKIGLERTNEMILSADFEQLLVLPLRRLSYHLHSLSYHIENSLYNLHVQIGTLKGVITNFSFRAIYLLGIDVTKPEIISASKLNSMEIYTSARLRNGVSPGLIASQLFFPYFPLNMILWTIIIVLIIRKINDIFSDESKPSLITLFFVLVYFQGIVDSSVDFLNPIGKAGLSLAILLVVWLARPKKVFI